MLSDDMRKRSVGLRFKIDANLINARQKLESMNTLEQWHRDGVIEIGMAEPATKEVLFGGDKARTSKAARYIHSFSYGESPEEKVRWNKIEEILFPAGAKDQNQMNDVEIVFIAGRTITPLITNDGDSKRQPGGILGNKDRLKNELNITVLRDIDAIRKVKHAIKNRDGRARKIAEMEGLDLPEWVGQD